MKKTRRNVIATVSTVAMMGVLTLGMVKVIDVNNKANSVFALEQTQDDELEQARLDFKAKQLEVNTDQVAAHSLENENVVKLELDRLEKKHTLEKGRLEKKNTLEQDRLEKKHTLEKGRLEKKNTLEQDRLEKNEGRFNDYLELNGVKTPEELASLGPDKFIVDEAEWAAAKVKWLERNPGYTEEDADNARGQYETDRWLEILEYYGIHPANNEKGWEYIKKDTLEDDILECLEEAPIEETNLEEF